MGRLWTITAREYASFFRVPLGWIVVALFLLLSGIIFARHGIQPGQPATLRPFFQIWWTLLAIVAPAISMRLLSEELRTGTVETLLTTPVAEGTVVAGKYLASVLFLMTMLAPTLVYVVVLESLSRPDYGPIVAGYLGILLLGMLYLAVGTLASAVTPSQTLAFLGALFVILLIEVMASQVAPLLPAPLDGVVYGASPGLRITDFARGLIDMEHVVYFLAASAWFLALAAVVLESRRWR